MSTYIYKKGFTLIELLVVIAIIGMLSAVILSSLDSARNKGRDAAVKEELSNLRAEMELLGQNAGSYSGVCVAGQPVAMLQSASQSSQSNNSSYVCNSGPAQNSTVWAAQVPLTTSGQYWCVDWNGNSKQESAALSNNTTCP